MIINSLYDVKIFIENVELLNSGSASNVMLVINESIEFGIPTCVLKFTSSREFVGQLPLTDGSKIVVKVSSNFYSINEVYNFRVSDVKFTNEGGNINFAVEGVYNCYEIFRSAYKYSLYGNSSDVFKNIMQKNQINGILHKTDDMQLWCPSEVNLGKWLSYIANHAWSSEQSGMFWMIDRTGTMSYLDIDRLVHGANNLYMFLYGDISGEDVKNKILRYKSYYVHMNTGDENLFNCGYNGNNFHFDLDSYSIKHENANKVRASSEIININKELSQGLVDDLLQFDVGNHHKHFFVASSQNKRVLSTYSTYVNIVCDYFFPVFLGQVCKINLVNSGYKSGKMSSFNMKHLVNKISIQITSASIGMNITMCSQGYNAQSTKTY